MAAALSVLCLGSACRESGSHGSGQDGGNQDASPSVSTNDVSTSASDGKDDLGQNGGADAGPSGDVSADIGVRFDAQVDTGVSIDASASSSWSAACSAYAKALCGLMAYSPEYLKMEFGTEENCEGRYGGAACESRMASAGSNMTPIGLAACAQALTAQSYGDYLLRLPAECSVPGSRAVNSPCTYYAQCQSGVCVMEPAVFCGTCKAKVPLGVSCNPNARECEDGLVCLNYTCTTLTAEGSACTSLSECESGLACFGGFCVRVKSQGEACTDGIECDPQQDLTCIPNASGGGRSCMPITYASAGESCGSWAAMECLDSAVCVGRDATTGIGVCSAAVADGAPCTNGVTYCQAPSLCINGKCQTAADIAPSCN